MGIAKVTTNYQVTIPKDIRRTHKLELPDAIVAASAIITGATPITRNTKDFQEIHGLQLEKPY